jgi:NTP pyrophosphatase (non-canonical NTP hydrolase)
MTIREAQSRVDDWIRKYGVRYFSELTNMAILAEEVGEVARIIARTYGEQSPGRMERGREREMKEKLADELADVFFVLICLANQTGTDLGEAFRKNLEKKTSRDFVRHQQNDKLRDPTRET